MWDLFSFRSNFVVLNVLFIFLTHGLGHPNSGAQFVDFIMGLLKKTLGTDRSVQGAAFNPLQKVSSVYSIVYLCF